MAAPQPIKAKHPSQGLHQRAQQARILQGAPQGAVRSANQGANQNAQNGANQVAQQLNVQQQVQQDQQQQAHAKENKFAVWAKAKVKAAWSAVIKPCAIAILTMGMALTLIICAVFGTPALPAIAIGVAASIAMLIIAARLGHVSSAVVAKRMVRAAAAPLVLMLTTGARAVLAGVSLTAFLPVVWPLMALFAACALVTFVLSCIPRFKPLADEMVSGLSNCARISVGDTLRSYFGDILPPDLIDEDGSVKENGAASPPTGVQPTHTQTGRVLLLVSLLIVVISLAILMSALDRVFVRSWTDGVYVGSVVFVLVYALSLVFWRVGPELLAQKLPQSMYQLYERTVMTPTVQWAVPALISLAYAFVQGYSLEEICTALLTVIALWFVLSRGQTLLRLRERASSVKQPPGAFAPQTATERIVAGFVRFFLLSSVKTIVGEPPGAPFKITRVHLLHAELAHRTYDIKALSTDETNWTSKCGVSMSIVREIPHADIAPAWLIARMSGSNTWIVAVRGTKTPVDVYSDLKYVPRPIPKDRLKWWQSMLSSDWASSWFDGTYLGAISGKDAKFHGGALATAEHIWKKIEGDQSLVRQLKASDASVFFVGHSLGGAVAQIMAILASQSGVSVGGITGFGLPRVLQGEFAVSGFCGLKETCCVLNFVHDCDPVPRLLGSPSTEALLNMFPTLKQKKDLHLESVTKFYGFGKWVRLSAGKQVPRVINEGDLDLSPVNVLVNSISNHLMSDYIARLNEAFDHCNIGPAALNNFSPLFAFASH